MSRRIARDAAMRLIYAWEMGGEADLTMNDDALDYPSVNPNDQHYIQEVVGGIQQSYAQLDAEIEAFSNGWKKERIAKVDLSILRLALYEILYRDDVPESSAINEAVELAKKYGSDKSAKFVNGVLGGISRQRNQKQENQVERICGD